MGGQGISGIGDEWGCGGNGSGDKVANMAFVPMGCLVLFFKSCSEGEGGVDVCDVLAKFVECGIQIIIGEWRIAWANTGAEGSYFGDVRR